MAVRNDTGVRAQRTAATPLFFVVTGCVRGAVGQCKPGEKCTVADIGTPHASRPSRSDAFDEGDLRAIHAVDGNSAVDGDTIGHRFVYRAPPAIVRAVGNQHEVAVLRRVNGVLDVPGRHADVGVGSRRVRAVGVDVSRSCLCGRGENGGAQRNERQSNRSPNTSCHSEILAVE